MRQKWKLFSIILFGFIFLFTQCAGSKKVVEKPEIRESKPVMDESFDPMSIPDDSHITFPKIASEPEKEYFIQHEGKKPTMVDTLALLKKTIPGYRVQIFATKDRNQAYLLKDEATQIFRKDSINVYLIFNEPYYKIRIGDCKSREEATQLQRLAKNRGYTNAWIVKSPVLEFPELMWQTKNKE